MPVLDSLAARSTLGRAAVIPEGMPPGSDVGNMSILGFDPAEFHTGRAPIEAAAIGLRFPADRIAFRCNLSLLGDDDTMIDFAGGHPDDDAAGAAIADLQATLGSRSWGRGALAGAVEFHAGVGYRHTLVAPASWLETECVPPHDMTGTVVKAPTGAAAEILDELMAASRAVLARHNSVLANQIWLWGQGHQPALPSFTDHHGVTAGIVTAVDLVRGLGVLTDMAVPVVEGANGWYDTNYEGKMAAAVEGLRSGADLYVIHIEATDEAGHAGNVEEKVKALENWDSRVLAGMVPALDEIGPWRMLMLPDHATPLATRTHTSDPVPYLLFDSEIDGPGGVYTEAGVADKAVVAGHKLMGMLLSR